MRWSQVRRGYDRWLVLVPGWAFDARVFASLDLPFDYLLADSLQPSTFDADLLAALDQRNLPRVSLLGWSLGAVLALKFAQQHPALVEQLWLVSVRPSYSADEIHQQRQTLLQDPSVALADFYRRALVGQRQDRAFVEPMLHDPQAFPTEALEGLDFLQAHPVTAAALDQTNAKLIHGARDVIAPLARVEALLNACHTVTLHVVASAGHLPIVQPCFASLWMDTDQKSPA